MSTPIKNGYDFTILTDDVSEVDLFEDKTHENTSNVIYRLITSSDKGITIGLEGGWGSGKSTVINLLREQLAHDKNTFFFTFDSWAHDDDPLRRIFLESLIQGLDPDGQHKELTEIAKKISGRSKTVDVKLTKGASKLGKLLSACALVIPLGASLLNKVNYDLLTWPWSNSAPTVSWLFIFGFPLASSPFWVALYWAFLGDTQNEKRNWDFFSSKATETHTQEISDDSERTSIEFEQIFNKILHIASHDLKFDKLIVVIDNLDRIEPESAKSIWSTLQTFFKHRASNNTENKYLINKLWFVIPYDKEGLSKIWKISNGDNISDASKSFLQKSFQVIAEVPEPVMSGWIGYFGNCINEALTGWPEEVKDRIVRTYQILNSTLGSSPNPRKIRSFINQVGMNGMRWGSIMSPEAICVYSFLRQEHSEQEVRRMLLDNKTPNVLEGKGNLTNLNMELAGMLFGVNKERGFQLLLKPEISNAIRTGDGDILKELVEKYGNAFWLAWGEIKTSILPSNAHNQEYIINAIDAIFHGLSNHKDRLKNDINILIESTKSTVKDWEFDNYYYSSQMNNLLDLSDNDPAFLTWLSTNLKELLTDTIKNINTEKFSSETANEINQIVRVIKSHGGQFPSHSYPNLTKDTWPVWLDIMSKSEDDFPEVLPMNGTIRAIANDTFTNPTIAEKKNLITLNRALKLFADNAEFDEVITLLCNWLVRADREINIDSIYQLAILLYSKHKGKSPATIKATVENSALWERIKTENPSSIPHAPYLIGLISPDKIHSGIGIPQNIIDFWTLNPTEEMLSAIYKKVLEFSLPISIWTMAKDKRNMVAISIIRNIDSSEIFSLNQGMLFIDEFDWATDNDQKSIINKLTQHGGLEASKGTMKSDPLVYDECLAILHKHGNSDSIIYVQDIVQSIHKESWIELFENESSLIDLAPKAKHFFSDAFRDFTMAVINDQASGEFIWEKYDSLIEKAVDKELVLKAFLVEYLKDEDEKISDAGFLKLSQSCFSFIEPDQMQQLMNKLIVLLDKATWPRITTLLNSNLPIIEKPLDGLVSRINHEIKLLANEDTQEDRKEAIQMLAEKCVIDLNIETPTDVKPDQEE